jgi:hypothetical protein
MTQKLRPPMRKYLDNVTAARQVEAAKISWFKRARLFAKLWLKFRVLLPIRLAWFWLQYKMGKRRVPMRLHRHPLLRGRNDPCWCGSVDDKTGKVRKYKNCHWYCDRKAGF